MPRVKCSHCHLEFDEDIMLKSGDKYFCCLGCKSVYEILNAGGLESFYEKLGNNTIAPPIESANDDLAKFDNISFEERFLKTTEDGFTRVDLIIEGIHCAACVWLNEKVLINLAGVKEANINFSTNKAKIIYNKNKIKLSEIILKIRSIGYNAYAYDASVVEQKSLKRKRIYIIKMMIAIFASMNIMMLSLAKYTGFFTGINKDVTSLIHFGEFILSTPVLFYSGSLFYKGAYYGLKNKFLNMDFLVITGASLTYFYSVYVMMSGVGGTYFDSVTMIITFVLVGKYLELIGKKSASDTLDKIKSSLPLEASIIKNGQAKTISLDEIKVGDIVELKAGQKAMVDGEVTQGEANFDESSITGEAQTVYKKIASKICSGTINTDGLIRFKVLKNFANSTLNSIVTLLEDSLSSKSNIENRANAISKYFTFTILSLACLSFVFWYFFGGTLYFAPNASSFEKAFIVSISVIVIACPCALALATPIASLIGINLLAKKSLLFKEAKHIETLARANTLVLDKTGTLTKGKLKVVNFMQNSQLSQKELGLLYSLVCSSEHLVSQAIAKYLSEKYKHIENLSLEGLKNIQARGMQASYQGLKILGGNKELFDEYNIKYDFENTQSNSLYLFALGDEYKVSFKLEDELKENAKDFIEKMKKMKLDILMLTGDNTNVAKKLCLKLGIDNYKAHLNPLQKAEAIKELKKDKIVVMVGDGLNDSLALSTADIGIVMGAGADISIFISDIVLLNNTLNSLYDAFKISKRTYFFIKQNLIISLLYNLITVPLAIFGYVVPLFAALSMSLSSLLVVANSFRIRQKDK